MQENWKSLAKKLTENQARLGRQLDTAKGRLGQDGARLRDDRIEWQRDWTSSRPDDMDSAAEWLESMRSRWAALAKRKASLQASGSRLGMEFADISGEGLEIYDTLESGLLAEEENCKYINEFLDELKEYEEEEWSLANKMLPRFYMWLDSWEARARVRVQVQVQPPPENEKGPDTSHIAQRICRIRQGLSYIEILRGNELVDEHWIELFSILKINDIRSTRNVTLGQLLQHHDKLRDSHEHVKVVAEIIFKICPFFCE